MTEPALHLCAAGLLHLSGLLLAAESHSAVMRDVAFSSTLLHVADFGCRRGVIFAEDND